MQYDLITYDGAKPKRRMGIIAAWFVVIVSAVVPLWLRTRIVFALNFVFNHVRATVRLLFAVLFRQIAALGIILTYFLVLGPTAILARLTLRDYLSVRKKKTGSLFTEKEPADVTSERFERQY